jgi:hypothetical protein
VVEAEDDVPSDGRGVVDCDGMVGDGLEEVGEAQGRLVDWGPDAADAARRPRRLIGHSTAPALYG